MKKIICILLFFTIILVGNTNTATAVSIYHSKNTEYLADGSCFVTTIDMIPESTLISTYSTSLKRSGKKTVTYKSSSGAKLWSITVNGTFTYVKGKSALCTNSSVSTSIYSSLWKINKKSSSKTKNKATATATATQYYASTAVGSITKSVTLTCSVNGTLS